MTAAKSWWRSSGFLAIIFIRMSDSSVRYALDDRLGPDDGLVEVLGDDLQGGLALEGGRPVRSTYRVQPRE